MWLAPLFLLGLAGLALPLWLHRFARDTDDKRRYASLMLMEAAEVQRSRKRQLKYWLLLLLQLGPSFGCVRAGEAMIGSRVRSASGACAVQCNATAHA